MGKFLAGLLLGVILLPAVLLLVSITGYLPVSATGDPAKWEEKFDHFALAKGIARQAPVSKIPSCLRGKIY